MIPGARLLVNEHLIVSAVQVDPPESHGFGNEHVSGLEFLALEEMRFLAAIVLAVHPNDGMVYTYPMYDHVDFAFEIDDNGLIEAAERLTTRISKDS